eukprot:TRINITY_DN4315_c0_g1_i7.p1 TRINITY_DN4315_c0_g1~~TRINITY_DN4315_c0_g1_i7.p1  ORF type:complete len:624 (+),score=143.71 TRINITY_DN4315_c0_g1_i7:106-1977(+)
MSSARALGLFSRGGRSQAARSPTEQPPDEFESLCGEAQVLRDLTKNFRTSFEALQKQLESVDRSIATAAKRQAAKPSLPNRTSAERAAPCQGDVSSSAGLQHGSLANSYGPLSIELIAPDRPDDQPSMVPPSIGGWTPMPILRLDPQDCPQDDDEEYYHHVPKHSEEAAAKMVKSHTAKVAPSQLFEPFSDLSEDEHQLSHLYSHQKVLRKRLVSQSFNYKFGLVLVANGIFMGFQTDYLAREDTLELPFFMVCIDGVFCVLFIMEHLLRWYAYGPCEYLRKSNWHIFEVVVVGLQVVQQYRMLMYGGAREVHKQAFDRILQMLQLLRLFRVLRLARYLGHISELRMLFVSLVQATKFCGCVALFLLATIYTLALFLTQTVNFHQKTVEQLGEAQEPENEELVRMYGDVARSIFSLYQMVSDGVHWGEIADPLVEQVSPAFRVVFFMFATFSIFAVSNIVTGFFVDNAMYVAAEDKKAVLVNELRRLFRRADSDGSGALTWTEFEKQLDNEYINRVFQEVDVDPHDARVLFKLMDIDDSGDVNEEELVHGCQKLIGSSRAVDLALFVAEWRKWSLSMESKLTQLHVKVMAVCTAERAHSKKTMSITGTSPTASQHVSRFASSP